MWCDVMITTSLIMNFNVSIMCEFQVMPVLELAEHEVRKRQLIPTNLAIKWIPYDDKCDASYATISAMDGYGIDCGHVLFGPTCEYALGNQIILVF